MGDEPDFGYPQWVRLECACGHHARVCLPPGPYRLRYWILPRARCTKCGRRGAQDVQMTLAPGEAPSGQYPKF